MVSWLEPPPLPHEHGAWAMLIVPLVLGLAAVFGGPAAAGGAPSSATWLVPPAMALLFLSRYAAVAVATRLIDGKRVPEGFFGRRILWATLYVGAAAALLVIAWRLVPAGSRHAAAATGAVTLALGGLHTLLVFAGVDRTGPGEIVGMAGLASSATLVVVASGAPLDRRAVGAGILALLYFASSLAYVRAVRRLWKRDRKGRRRCVGAHAMIAAAIAQLAIGSFLPLPVAAAFLPVFARTAWGLAAPPANLRTLGWREAGVSAAFTAIAAAGYLL